MTQQEVIQAFMGSLDTTTLKGEAALDAAIKACSTFNSIQEAIDQMVADCKNAKSADDFLKTYCGIDLDNDDTGAITGKDAGGSTVKTKNSIVLESGSLDDSPDNEFTVNGFIIKLADAPHWDIVGNNGSFTYIDYEDLDDDTQKYIWKALYNWWASGALNLITESYGDNFGFYKKDSTTVKEIAFGFVNMDNSDLAATSRWSSDSGKTINGLSITVNMKAYNSIIIDNVDGKMSDSDNFYLDRTLAHEFTHAVMAANIDYIRNLPQFIKEGMAELTHGIDDEGNNLIKSLATNAGDLDKWLDISNSNTGQTNAYAAGYMFLRYLARQAGDLTIENSSDSIVRTFRGNDSITNFADKASINSGESADYIYNNQGASVTMNGGAGNDSLHNYIGDYLSADAGAGDDYFNNYQGSNVTVNGGAGSDFLQNIKGTNVSLFGGADKDTIVNQGNNVTLSGGTGNDSIYNAGSSNVLFKYTSGDGNDTITGFNATSTLQIGNGTGTYSTVKSGNNIVVTVGNGKISLMGAASLSSVNIEGKQSTSTKTLTLTNSSKAAVTLSASIITGDASARTTAIKITGNALDNSILGSSKNDTLYGKDGNDYLAGNAGVDKLYGGNGADTLWGGSGNDSLWGNGGNDVFIYTAGNDIIADYATGDKISLGAAITNASLSSSSVVLTTKSGRVTVKNAKDKTLSLITSEGKSLSTLISSSMILTDDSKAAVTVSSSIGSADATARTKAIKITGNSLDNSILGGTGKDTLYGKDGNDYLSGGSGNDKLYGQNDNDTLWGGTGNDTLTGGSGNDLFIYSTGNDFITDYTAGEDKISLGAAIKNASLSGSDVKLKVGSNTLTVKNAKDKTLSLITSEGKSLSTLISSSMILTDDSKAAVTVSSSIGSADATARTKAIKITGNSLDNSILGGTGKDTLYGKDGNDYLAGNAGVDKLYGGDGDDTLIGGSGNDSIWGNDGDDYLEGNVGVDKLYGGDGDDTLIGGAGNDSLWGNDGNDVFIYNSGDGKDIISDFDDDDMLEITDSFSASVNSAGSVVFKVGSTAGAITLKNCTAETINVNGTAYTISGNNLKFSGLK